MYTHSSFHRRSGICDSPHNEDKKTTQTKALINKLIYISHNFSVHSVIHYSFSYKKAHIIPGPSALKLHIK